MAQRGILRWVRLVPWNASIANANMDRLNVEGEYVNICMYSSCSTCRKTTMWFQIILTGSSVQQNENYLVGNLSRSKVTVVPFALCRKTEHSKVSGQSKRCLGATAAVPGHKIVIA